MGILSLQVTNAFLYLLSGGSLVGRVASIQNEGRPRPSFGMKAVYGLLTPYGYVMRGLELQLEECLQNIRKSDS